MESLHYELNKNVNNGVKTTTICPVAMSTGMFKSPTTRFPSLLPVCDAKYVAQQTINAIREDRMLIIVPRYLEFIHALSG